MDILNYKIKFKGKQIGYDFILNIKFQSKFSLFFFRNILSLGVVFGSKFNIKFDGVQGNFYKEVNVFGYDRVVYSRVTCIFF